MVGVGKSYFQPGQFKKGNMDKSKVNFFILLIIQVGNLIGLNKEFLGLLTGLFDFIAGKT